MTLKLLTIAILIIVLHVGLLSNDYNIVDSPVRTDADIIINCYHNYYRYKVKINIF